MFFYIWCRRRELDDSYLFLQVHHAEPRRVTRARGTRIITLEDFPTDERGNDTEPVQGGCEWEGRSPRTSARNYRD